MAIGVAQLPREMCKTPRFLQGVWSQMGEALADYLDPILIEHRDDMFRTHIGLPLDY